MNQTFLIGFLNIIFRFAVLKLITVENLNFWIWLHTNLESSYINARHMLLDRKAAMKTETKNLEDFFPKGSNFDEINQEGIDETTIMLNQRLRKELGYFSSENLHKNEYKKLLENELF